MSVRLLENPNDQQVKEIVKVFHEANKRKFFLFALKDESLVEPFIEAMVRGTVIGGQLYVVETPDGIVGATLWFGPGQISLGSEEQRQAGWNQLMEKLDDATRRWFVDVFLASSLHDVPDKLYGQGGQKAAYHLQLFGVLPQCQGKGYGKALLHHVEEKAKSEGVDVVLETVGLKNVPMYKAFGYDLLGCGSFVLPEGLGDPFPVHCFRKRF
ncbi:acetyltransferase [Moniliophthora roreri MCA 2997]|uniref:Acetyltransferase n=2 Tax=Moniliophthora roreri TaxID=221103 RepID=V2X883_MONRO|nr:acetyltransferase [Moniliophthora roreri MCA 2997]KAI3603072.1 acetyltransferase [Moniliophthora roreri]